MEQSPSGKALSSSASQEITRISRNPMANYCSHKSLHLVTIISHISPAQTHRPNLFLGDPFQYYPPNYVCLPDGLYPSGFPTKTCTILSPPHICYVPHPAYSSWFQHSNNIWWRLQTMKLIMKSPLFPCKETKYLPQHTPSNIFSLCSYLSVKDQVSHPYKTKHKNVCIF